MKWLHTDTTVFICFTSHTYKNIYLSASLGRRAVIIYANQIKFTYVTLDHNLRHCLLRLPLQKWSIASIFITWPICYPMMGLVKVTRLFHPMNSKQNEAVFYFAPFSDQWYRRKRTPRHFERQMKKPKGHLKGNFKVKYKMCTYTNTLPMPNELWL